jgi:hypothetical protein
MTRCWDACRVCGCVGVAGVAQIGQSSMWPTPPRPPRKKWRRSYCFANSSLTASGEIVDLTQIAHFAIAGVVGDCHCMLRFGIIKGDKSPSMFTDGPPLSEQLRPIFCIRRVDRVMLSLALS